MTTKRELFRRIAEFVSQIPEEDFDMGDTKRCVLAHLSRRFFNRLPLYRRMSRAFSYCTGVPTYMAMEIFGFNGCEDFEAIYGWLEPTQQDVVNGLLRIAETGQYENSQGDVRIID